jgi:hypothetical protein
VLAAGKTLVTCATLARGDAPIKEPPLVQALVAADGAGPRDGKEVGSTGRPMVISGPAAGTLDDPSSRGAVALNARPTPPMII